MSDGMTHKRTVEVDREDYEEMVSLKAGRVDADNVYEEWYKLRDGDEDYPVEYGRDKFAGSIVKWEGVDGEHTVKVPADEVFDACKSLAPAHDDEVLDSIVYVKREDEPNVFRVTYEQKSLPVKSEDAPRRLLEVSAPTARLVGGMLNGAGFVTSLWAAASASIVTTLVAVALTVTALGTLKVWAWS